MKNILVITLMFFSTSLLAQKHYKISWGVDSYDTLTQYETIDLLHSPMGIDTVFQLGFKMPVYDTFFTEVRLGLDGYGDFSNGNNYYADVYFFAADFAPFYPTMNLYKSDWRYEQTTVDDLKVLKVEWKNMALLDEILADTVADHYINFQAWFFENGNIELHMGNLKLDETKYFSDTTGFVFDDGDSYGPWVGIADSSYKNVYYVSGPDSALREGNSEDSSDIIYGVPTVGRYYRFEKLAHSSSKSSVNVLADFSIYPNPANELLHFSAINSGLVEIVNQTGVVVKTSEINKTNNNLKIEELPTGIYMVRFTSEGGQMTVKKLLISKTF